MLACCLLCARGGSMADEGSTAPQDSQSALEVEEPEQLGEGQSVEVARAERFGCGLSDEASTQYQRFHYATDLRSPGVSEAPRSPNPQE